MESGLIQHTARLNPEVVIYATSRIYDVTGGFPAGDTNGPEAKTQRSLGDSMAGGSVRSFASSKHARDLYVCGLCPNTLLSYCEKGVNAGCFESSPENIS